MSTRNFLPTIRAHSVFYTKSDITTLRAYLPSSHTQDSFESVTLSPALLSIIGPLLSRSSTAGTSTSTSATAALTARVALLQQENDELYGLLKSSAVGKLKEEVTALRRAVGRLEGALKGALVISYLLVIVRPSFLPDQNLTPWSHLSRMCFHGPKLCTRNSAIK